MHQRCIHALNPDVTSSLNASSIVPHEYLCGIPEPFVQVLQSRQLLTSFHTNIILLVLLQQLLHCHPCVGTELFMYGEAFFANMFPETV